MPLTFKQFQNGWTSTVADQNIIPQYLEHICMADPSTKTGILTKKYQNSFKQEYLVRIEQQVLVYKTTKGLIDLGDFMDASEFQRRQDEVMIKFKSSNKTQFEVAEAVSIKLKVKNVPELVIKVFEFNTETYYKKNLRQFDTSVNLHGMVPSILKFEKEAFKDVPKNKITDFEVKLEEMKGKCGLFIIEFEGNGNMSRAIVKKGSLTLISKATAAGHISFILDHDKNICKGDGTGVWLNK